MKGHILALLCCLSGADIAAAASLPVPPIPPAEAPLPDAPVPDRDVIGPPGNDARSPVTIDLNLHRRGGPPRPGLGYTPGSRYEGEEDRRLLTLPGIRFHVPFP
ncbi:MAG: hypothetical protein EXR07_09350 [Acetobacteraceae bacterium]|nr:hypothetical protein [Acetobacteraceae bacterium]